MTAHTLPTPLTSTRAAVGAATVQASTAYAQTHLLFTSGTEAGTESTALLSQAGQANPVGHSSSSNNVVYFSVVSSQHGHHRT